VPYRIDAAVPAPQQAPTFAPVDLTARDAEREQLTSRDDAELVGCQAGEEDVSGFRSIEHTLSVPGKTSQN